jgi:hypothetical protein
MRIITAADDSWADLEDTFVPLEVTTPPGRVLAPRHLRAVAEYVRTQSGEIVLDEDGNLLEE